MNELALETCLDEEPSAELAAAAEEAVRHMEAAPPRTEAEIIAAGGAFITDISFGGP